MASWYGKQFHGNRTANGETYDMFAMTAAHPVLPIPSYVRVTNVRSGRSVIVRVNDRGPFKHDRVIDLSYAAATKLGIAATGTGEVEVERITMTQIASGDGGGAIETARAAEPPAAPVSTLAAASAPVAVVPISASSGGGSNWSVQLGAFSQQANAEAFAARASALLGLVDAGSCRSHCALRASKATRACIEYWSACCPIVRLSSTLRCSSSAFSVGLPASSCASAASA
jgi:rare lipoprotein A